MVAFLVAPLVAAFGVALAGFVRSTLADLNLFDLAIWTFVFYIYAAWAAILLGLPSYFLMRKLKIIRWWSTMLVGLIIGILVFVLVDPRGIVAVWVNPGGVALWGGIGAVSAFTFWVIWRYGHRTMASQPL
jgi:hypothetical protein